MKDNNVDKNCKNCRFEGFQKCLRDQNGKVLDDKDVDQGSFDKCNESLVAIFGCSNWERCMSKHLEDRVEHLEEIVFNRILYPDCIHKKGISCDCSENKYSRCDVSMCPELHNPN